MGSSFLESLVNVMRRQWWESYGLSKKEGERADKALATAQALLDASDGDQFIASAALDEVIYRRFDQRV